MARPPMVKVSESFTKQIGGLETSTGLLVTLGERKMITHELNPKKRDKRGANCSDACPAESLNLASWLLLEP